VRGGVQVDLRAWEVQYPFKLRAPGVAMYWRILGPPQAQLIEVALAAATPGYVAVGWRPASLDQVSPAPHRRRTRGTRGAASPPLLDAQAPAWVFLSGGCLFGLAQCPSSLGEDGGLICSDRLHSARTFVCKLL
jgi:hypothetical protein